MQKGYFTNRISLLSEVKRLLLLLFCLVITIVNPVSWVVYILLKFFLAKGSEFDDNTINYLIQFVAFIAAIISYIVFIIYLMVHLS